jgi:hypothetical protein
MMLRHKIEGRISKLEKTVAQGSEPNVLDFFKKFTQIIDGTSKGIPRDNERAYSNVSEEINRLFADYPEQAETFGRLLEEIEGDTIYE